MRKRISPEKIAQALRQVEGGTPVAEVTRKLGVHENTFYAWKKRFGNHTMRATGITAYLKAEGTLEHAQQMANHSSPRTTMLYDRRGDEIARDEYEKIRI